MSCGLLLVGGCGRWQGIGGDVGAQPLDLRQPGLVDTALCELGQPVVPKVAGCADRALVAFAGVQFGDDVPAGGNVSAHMASLAVLGHICKPYTAILG